jgi:serine/threonine protein kinase
MSNKIGRFEILSEIAHSDRGSIYKASDPEAGKTVALKTLRLESLGEQAPALVASLLQEAEASKALNSHNIALLYGAGEIDGVFCAELEYVQGNSIGTMLTRKEGFSIWDLMDIARQTCQGLDHANTKKVFHHTLEPAKIMVTWDGTVKVLGFGISTMSAFASHATGAAPEVLYYMSPEQLAGDPLDARSNVFSLGAILYEMVTERKAFNGDDAEAVRQAIQGSMPVAPDQVNRKIHPALSQLIMKALAKNPDERYASGQDLVNDLERCKESTSKAATKTPGAPAKTAGPAKTPPGIVQPTKLGGGNAAPPAATPASAPKPAVTTAPAAQPLAKAAAAGVGAPTSSDSLELETFEAGTPSSAHQAKVEPTSKLSAEPGLMSSAAVDDPEVQTPKIAVDPMMADGAATGTAARSFSEIEELPPLKEKYVAPPPPKSEQPQPEVVHNATFREAEPEKPKVQPKEVAKRAVKEIQKTPPQLFIYSIAGAALIILLIVGGIAYHIHSQNADEDTPPPATTAATESTSQPAQQAAATPAPAAQNPPPAQITAEPPAEEQPSVSIKPKATPGGKKKSKQAQVAPTVVPGQLSISSTPVGAQIQIDGQTSSSWVTPYDIPGLSPGQHSVVISKAGYASDSRNIEVASGGKSVISVQLAPLTATVAVTSDPAGAEVWMDGRDTGKSTPAQLTTDKAGNHSFVVKKQGYLDESVSANLQIGATSHLTTTMRALGSADDVRIGGGKFKKIFGGSDTAGMGSVAVKTTPKGAQVAINNRMLDKLTPLEFYLNPGNYIVDITASGFKPIHKVVTVEKNGKLVIDENMDRE